MRVKSLQEALKYEFHVQIDRTGKVDDVEYHAFDEAHKNKAYDLANQTNTAAGTKIASVNRRDRSLRSGYFIVPLG